MHKDYSYNSNNGISLKVFTCFRNLASSVCTKQFSLALQSLATIQRRLILTVYIYFLIHCQEGAERAHSKPLAFMSQDGFTYLIMIHPENLPLVFPGWPTWLKTWNYWLERNDSLLAQEMLRDSKRKLESGA